MENKYKVLSETGIVLDGSEEVITTGSVIALDPEAEQTKALLENGSIEVVAEEEEEKKNDDKKEDEVDAAIAPKEKLMYMGKEIIASTTRTVNDKTYQHVTLADSTTHDLTEAEYSAQVSVVK